jgi:hypothetical protein
MAGVPARVIMEIGGWKTRSMLDRYCVTDEQQIEDALAQVCDFVAKRSATP